MIVAEARNTMFPLCFRLSGAIDASIISVNSGSEIAIPLTPCFPSELRSPDTLGAFPAQRKTYFYLNYRWRAIFSILLTSLQIGMRGDARTPPANASAFFPSLLFKCRAHVHMHRFRCTLSDAGKKWRLGRTVKSNKS